MSLYCIVRKNIAVHQYKSNSLLHIVYNMFKPYQCTVIKYNFVSQYKKVQRRKFTCNTTLRCIRVKFLPPTLF